MNIRECNQPCLVAQCQRCAAKTWPPSETKAGAERIAKEDWGFVVFHVDARGQRIDPLTLCAACAEAEVDPASEP